MVDAQTVSIVFAGLSIGVAAIYYALNIKHQRETRQAQLFMQIYNRWASKEVSLMEQEFLFEWEWDDYDDFSRKYLSNVEARALRSSIGKYWEGIGVLVKRELIDPYLVDDLMSSAIMMYWEKYAPVCREYRRRIGYPQAAEYQEYLYERIKAIAEQQHPELKT
jgi:hypothetical protein